MADTMKFMGTALAYLPDYADMIQPRVSRDPELPQAWAIDLVEWLRTMVRKHGLICVGYEKLFKMMACDPMVVQTLALMGIAAPSWEALLQAARIQCQGWDEFGVYFIGAGTGNISDGCGILDDMMFGRAWVVPKHRKNVPRVQYIGVPGVSPKPLVGMQ